MLASTPPPCADPLRSLPSPPLLPGLPIGRPRQGGALLPLSPPLSALGGFAIIVALALGLADAPRVHAQQPVLKYVGNYDQPRHGGVQLNVDEEGVAQEFTTGGSPAGYVLDHFTVHVTRKHESRYMTLGAGLYTVRSDGSVGSLVTGLAHTQDYESRESYRFWANTQHTVLQPAQRYMLLIACRSGCSNDNYVEFATTQSPDVDPLGPTADAHSPPDMADTFVLASDGWAPSSDVNEALAMSVYAKLAVPPRTPGRVTATIPTDSLNSVLFEWSISAPGLDFIPSEGIQLRNKLSSETDYGNWVLINNSKPGETNAESYTLISLTNGVSYDFQVRALNMDGASGASSVVSGVPGVHLGICSRTRAVQLAIIDLVSEVNDCALVTAMHLRGIQSLTIHDALTELKRGDFDGLTSLTLLSLPDNDLTELPTDVFDPLTSLETLYLADNNLTELIGRSFKELSSLKALYLSNNDITELPAGVFDPLTSLETLYLNGNQLTALSNSVFDRVPLKFLWLNNNLLDELHPDVFATLTSLETLLLLDNQLSDLPAGLFEDLSQLSSLQMEGNTVDPLLLSVNLELVGQSQFKAVAPEGAPFDIVLPVSVTNGSIAGGAGTVTIPAGALESAATTVTRSIGVTSAVTIDIGTVPTLPMNHSGYQFAKSADLPVTMPGITVTPTFLTVDEGESATYTLVLDTQPTGAVVTVRIGGTSGTDVRVEDDYFVFTVLDWSTPQTVTVISAEDTDLLNDRAILTHEVVSDGLDYAALAVDDVEVIVLDDDRGMTTGVPALALVSNTGQTSSTISSVGPVGEQALAQQFTTGDNPSGYALSSVQIYLTSFIRTNRARVSIYAADASGNPSSSRYTLTNLSAITSGSLNTFTAPAGATLEKETKYFVVVESLSGHFSVGRTASDGEDSGQANGWSIYDVPHGRNSDSENWFAGTSTDSNVRIAVQGTLRPIVTIAADVDAVIYNLLRNEFDLDNASFTVTRDGSTTEALTVTLTLTQDQSFLPSNGLIRTITFQPGSSSAQLEILQVVLSQTVTGDGILTATLDTASAYSVGTDSTASVAMNSVDTAVKVGIKEDAYTVPENEKNASFSVVAETADGVPAPSSPWRLGLALTTHDDEATSPADYTAPEHDGVGGGGGLGVGRGPFHD